MGMTLISMLPACVPPWGSRISSLLWDHILSFLWLWHTMTVSSPIFPKHPKKTLLHYLCNRKIPNHFTSWAVRIWGVEAPGATLAATSPQKKRKGAKAADGLCHGFPKSWGKTGSPELKWLCWMGKPVVWGTSIITLNLFMAPMCSLCEHLVTFGGNCVQFWFKKSKDWRRSWKYPSSAWKCWLLQIDTAIPLNHPFAVLGIRYRRGCHWSTAWLRFCARAQDAEAFARPNLGV